MTRWAALLKGVNVGGNRKLPMAELRALIEGLGHTEVRTLLASGNVLFSGEGAGAALEASIETALAAHGCTTDVLVRDRAALEEVVAVNPFPEAARERPSHLLAVFHREPFPAALLASIPEIHAGAERLHAHGRTLFIDYGDGIGESKLPQAMAKLKFPKLATARNWNTVTKLAGMLAA